MQRKADYSEYFLDSLEYGRLVLGVVNGNRSSPRLNLPVFSPPLDQSDSGGNIFRLHNEESVKTFANYVTARLIPHDAHIMIDPYLYTSTQEYANALNSLMKAISATNLHVKQLYYAATQSFTSDQICHFLAGFTADTEIDKFVITLNSNRVDRQAVEKLAQVIQDSKNIKACTVSAVDNLLTYEDLSSLINLLGKMPCLCVENAFNPVLAGKQHANAPVIYLDLCTRIRDRIDAQSKKYAQSEELLFAQNSHSGDKPANTAERPLSPSRH